jgi:ribosomal protein S27AE
MNIKRTRRKCPLCGHTNWKWRKIDDESWQKEQEKTPEEDKDWNLDIVVPLICANCGHAVLISLLDDDKLADFPPKKK